MDLPTKDKLQIARLMYAVVWTARTGRATADERVFRRHRLTWHLDLNEGIDFSIYSIGTFEPATIRHYARNIRPGSVVIDIGANIGAHTLPLADIVGSSGSILAIEATEYTYAETATKHPAESGPGLEGAYVPHTIDRVCFVSAPAHRDHFQLAARRLDKRQSAGGRRSQDGRPGSSSDPR